MIRYPLDFVIRSVSLSVSFRNPLGLYPFRYQSGLVIRLFLCNQSLDDLVIPLTNNEVQQLTTFITLFDENFNPEIP